MKQRTRNWSAALGRYGLLVLVAALSGCVTVESASSDGCDDADICPCESDELGCVGLAPDNDNQLGVCEGSYQRCWDDEWYEDYYAVEHWQEDETLCDGLDNDCDGDTDEDMGTLTCGVGVCEHTVEACIEGVPQACSPFEGAALEICDGLDNDCDGQTDEGELDGDCVDDNDCTTDVCVAGQGCRNQARGGACEDGDACTVDEVCSDGVCGGGVARTCDDENDCTEDTCDSADGCVFTAVEGSCDDGDACTEGETCSEGVCGGGTAVVCNDENVCTDDSCDSETGCVFPAAEGACDDGDPCTAGDTCSEGVCVPGAENLCLCDPISTLSCGPGHTATAIGSGQVTDSFDLWGETCGGYQLEGPEVSYAFTNTGGAPLQVFWTGTTGEPFAEPGPTAAWYVPMVLAADEACGLDDCLTASAAPSGGVGMPDPWLQYGGGASDLLLLLDTNSETDASLAHRLHVRCLSEQMACPVDGAELSCGLSARCDSATRTNVLGGTDAPYAESCTGGEASTAFDGPEFVWKLALPNDAPTGCLEAVVYLTDSTAVTGAYYAFFMPVDGDGTCSAPDPAACTMSSVVQDPHGNDRSAVTVTVRLCDDEPVCLVVDTRTEDGTPENDVVVSVGCGGEGEGGRR